MADQGVEHIDRPLRLFCNRIDPREVVQVDDPHARVAREWLQRDAMFARAHRIGGSASVGIRDTQAAVASRSGRHLHDHRIVCSHSAVGIRSGTPCVSQRAVRLRERERPRRAVVVEVGLP
jgi:hypothetical protein